MTEKTTDQSIHELVKLLRVEDIEWGEIGIGERAGAGQTGSDGVCRCDEVCGCRDLCYCDTVCDCRPA